MKTKQQPATLLPSYETLMAQAQVFASAWAIAGSRFDSGDGMEVANQEKSILADMFRRLHAENEILHAENESLSAARAAPAQPVAQWQKRRDEEEGGAWQNTSEADAKWWRDNSPGWQARALYTAPQPAAQAGEYPALGKGSLWRDAKGIRGYGADPGTGPWYTTEDVHRAIDAAMAAQKGNHD